MTDLKLKTVAQPQYMRVLKTTVLNNGEVFYAGYVIEHRAADFGKRHTVVADSRPVKLTKEEVKDLVVKYIEGLKKDFLQEVNSSEEEFF